MSAEQRRGRPLIAGALGLAVAGALVVGGFQWARRGTPSRIPSAPGADSPLSALAAAVRAGDARALAVLMGRLKDPTEGPDATRPALTAYEAGPWLDTLAGLRSGFLKFGGYGRTSALVVAGKVFDRVGTEPGRWVEALTPEYDLIVSGLADADPNVQVAALSEMNRFWSWAPDRTLTATQEQTLAAWKDALVAPVVRCLGASAPQVRVAAVACLGRLPLNDAALPALAYLEDKASGVVRQQVLISFAQRPALLSEDAIAKHLYDPEPNVPETAETVLRLRGLTQEQISLARLINHPKPGMRVSVIPLLRNRTDVDPVVWLVQLSRDDDDSVRQSALDALARQDVPEARDRILEMARSDRSAALRQAARLRLPNDPEATAALPPLPGAPHLNPKAN